MDASRALLWILFASAAAIALVQSLRLAWRETSARWRRQRRATRAFDGERNAEPLLLRAGFVVRARQARATLEYCVDGQPFLAEVRADYLVTRGGRAFVAEVKTGRACSLRTPGTRRQLLEYARAFEAHGVLLVDPENGNIQEIELAAPRPSRSLGRELLLVCFGAMLGASAALLALAS